MPKIKFLYAAVILWVFLVFLTSVGCNKNASRTSSQNALRKAVAQEEDHAGSGRELETTAEEDKEEDRFVCLELVSPPCVMNVSPTEHQEEVIEPIRRPAPTCTVGMIHEHPLLSGCPRRRVAPSQRLGKRPK
jgi:hypothetical protein